MVNKVKNENDVYQDLKVKNMPRINKRVKKAKKPQPQFKVNGKKSNHSHKIVGLLIIVFGIIFVLGLVMVIYRFAIKPSVKESVVVEKKVDTKKETKTVKNVKLKEKEEVKASSTEIVVVTDKIEQKKVDQTEKEKVVELDKKEANKLISDSDGDGVNDKEEQVFGSDINLNDSDQDGYPDLEEINHFYNPNGLGTLIADKIFSSYDNKFYTVIYPSHWNKQELEGGNLVVFTASNNDMIQISKQENKNNESIISWYEKTFPKEVITYNLIQNKKTWDGLLGPDGFNFYLTDKNKEDIYIISYIPVIEEEINYPNIFKIIINSFKIG